MSTVCLAVSTQYRIVTDTHTDRQTNRHFATVHTTLTCSIARVKVGSTFFVAGRKGVFAVVNYDSTGELVVSSLCCRSGSVHTCATTSVSRSS